jgi:hypothetical protein
MKDLREIVADLVLEILLRPLVDAIERLLQVFQ